LPGDPHLIMKTIVLIGRTGCGKTTLASLLTGKEIKNKKSTGVVREGFVIDTPGGFAENRWMAGALSIFAYEARVVGLVIYAGEPYSLFPPNINGMVNRDMVGIVTKKGAKAEKPELAEKWLNNAGCKRVFHVNLLSGEGVQDILDYLTE